MTHARELDITPAEYHADPAPWPSLSASIANRLLDRSPQHAWLRHPRLGGRCGEDTKATDRGGLLHKLLLGKGAEVQIVDAPDWRTKAARHARDDARENGRIPVLAKDHVEAMSVAQAIECNLEEQGVTLSTGHSEVAMLWREQAEHGDIWARAMLDHMVLQDGLCVAQDLKTVRSAHPDSCLRSVINYGYDVQAEAYVRAVEKVYPEFAGRVRFRFLFAEYEPPYAVTVAELDALMWERGRRRWREAVETWSHCLHTGEWPAYATEPVTLWAPAWLLRREEEESAVRGEEFVYEL